MYPHTVSSYSRLNDTINEILFDGRFCDLPVYIDVEGDLKTEICEKLGLDDDQLTEYVGAVVSETMEWNGSNGIYNWHCINHISWYEDRDKPPPFTALLLVLSIAAENMSTGEDISPINFYGRVAEIFGNLSYKDQISKCSATTVAFWQDLNRWLTENDFCYGRPTAQPIIPKWKFASYALSQALVRRSDRDSFHKLFDEYHLSKNDQLTHSEIEPYINEWINGPSSTVLLKKIWKRNHLQHRVIDAALEELDAWHSHKGSNGKIQSGRLLWIVQFQSYPIKKAKLKLCAACESIDHEYQLLSKDFQTANQTLIAESLSLNHFDGQDISFIGPTTSLPLEELMLEDLVLSDGDRLTFERKYRSIIPLLKQDNGYFYKEVSQILVFHQYQILCALSWKAKIITFLDTYAASGYQVMDSTANNGIPFGWCLFFSVELVKVPDDSHIHDDLYALVPSSRGLAFYPSGGLKLSGAGDVWHKWAPPSIFAVNDGVPLGIRLSPAGSDKDECLLSVADSVKQPNFLYKHGISILCNFTAQQFSFITYGEGSKGKKSEKLLRFRSADEPKKHPINAEYKLKYLVSQLDGELDWASASKQDNDFYLMGFDTTSLDKKESQICLNNYKNKQFLANDDIKYIDLINENYKFHNGTSNTPVCIERGVHAWLMPNGVTSKTKRAIQQCTDCGVRGIYRGKKSLPNSSLRKNTSIPRSSELTHTRLKPNRASESITHDTVLDALSYEGQGSGGLLYKWLGFLVDEPWQIRGIIKDYVDLGFIDIDIDLDSSRIKNWSVSPPVFVINEEGFSFLSGFRSMSLVNMVCKVLANQDITLDLNKLPSQPTQYTWKIDPEKKHKVAEELANLKLFRDLNVIESPARKILPYMPSARTITASCKPITPQLRDLQKFNLSSANWQDWEGPLSRGAYRHNHFPRRYFYMDKESKATQMPYEMVKITAANEEGLRLHDYDALNKEFTCILGCRLPGLYDRMLISCSGLLPDIVNGKLMIYKNIPSEIGEGILERFYG